MVEKRIGNRYRVLEKIGEGGMGAVYRAFDEQYPREVAVKRLRIVGANDSQVEQFILRFEREAKVQGQLQHPNIVRGLDYGHDDEGVYFVMEYLQNGSLSKVIGKQYEIVEAVDFIVPIAKALAYLHERGFVHRDVKPANILFDENGNLLLSDFGIIKLSEEFGEKTLTATGAAIGTPSYMAPELIRGEATAKVDQYALGIVFYELIFGCKPFVGKTPMQTMLMQQTSPLPNMTDIRSGLSPQVIQFLEKVLSKDPDQRFFDMTEFLRAIKELYSPIENSSKETPVNLQVEENTVIVEPVPEGQKQAQVDLVETEIVSPQTHSKLGRFVYLLIPLSLIIFFIVLFQKGLLGGSNSMSDLIAVSESATDLVEILQHTMTPDKATVKPLEWTNTPTLTSSVTEPVVTQAPSQPAGTQIPSSAISIRNVDGMPLVYIPEGEFRMGFTDEEVAYFVTNNFIDSEDISWLDSAQPAHEVYIDAFWIDQYEVSNQQFIAYLNDMKESKGTDYWWIWREGSNTEIRYSMSEWVIDEGYEDHPVVALNWNAAASYCAWVGGRLPTEAEWEKAARGEGSFLYPWGNELPSCDKANYIAREGTYCVQDTVPVDSYPGGVSPYGVYQMAGNAWEWVADWYGEDSYSSAKYENPTGVTFGDNHIIRGGAWNESELHLSSGERGNLTFNSFVRYGFRCVMDAD